MNKEEIFEKPIEIYLVTKDYSADSGGFSVMVEYCHQFFDGLILQTTSRRLEMLACLEALEQLPGNGPVTVHSYHGFLAQGMNNIENQKKNIDLWARLKKFCDSREVRFQYHDHDLPLAYKANSEKLDDAYSIFEDFGLNPDKDKLLETYSVLVDFGLGPDFITRNDVCPPRQQLYDQINEDDKYRVTLVAKNLEDEKCAIERGIILFNYKDLEVWCRIDHKNDPSDIPVAWARSEAIVGYLPLSVGQKVAPLLDAGVKFQGRLVEVNETVNCKNEGPCKHQYELTIDIFQADKLIMDDYE